MIMMIIQILLLMIIIIINNKKIITINLVNRGKIQVSRYLPSIFTILTVFWYVGYLRVPSHSVFCHARFVNCVRHSKVSISISWSVSNNLIGSDEDPAICFYDTRFRFIFREQLGLEAFANPSLTEFSYQQIPLSGMSSSWLSLSGILVLRLSYPINPLILKSSSKH